MKLAIGLSKLMSTIVIAALLPSGIMAVAQDQPDYQKHIDWAAQDTGHPNCTERYFANAILTSCLTAGNRSCVTGIAIEAAYRQQDQLALWLMAEITQCHNEGARRTLYDAGPQAVGNYLRTYQEPYWAHAMSLAF